ncbi:MAG TPA: D-alanyl-D-alanine carboxypeptidase/D-alanyl-D-alanine-endopeptidase [Pyrinomonadaceae bacterium]|jgi:D-alanyl-D-alanine carboxypeptidase/D-alanyl-D-alanine-endopeptidase (penicillin-binding protein 4)
MNNPMPGRRTRALVASSALILLILLVFAAERLPARLSTQSTAAQPEAASTGTKPGIQVSTSRSAVELGRRIDETIEGSAFSAARWGVYVMSLRDGRIIYARDAQRPFTPASNMKVYTTAVALDTLGADYRWRTSVYADKEMDARGTINGDLVLYGRGAPDLSSEAKKDTPDYLARLADDLYKRGVRHVQGNVIGDESYFRGEALGDGWLWNDIQWYFGAEVSALTINGNETTVTITPGKPDEAAAVKVENDDSYFKLTNDANTSARGSSLTIGVTRGLSDNNLRVWGDFPATGHSYSVRISVHNPALWAAKLFREELRARGIAVDGETKTIDDRVAPDQRFDPQRAVELAFVNSKSLGEIARATNKFSINLNAELILRTLGRERRDAAPDPDPVRMRIRGDDEAGTSFIRLWLERNGIQTAGLSLHDGSGLSRLDIVTPEATAQLHAAIAQTRSATVFRDSLPVAGRDGTLAGRLAVTGGRVQAKTGTLSYNNSLSGYVLAADDEPFAFAIICNDETAKGSSITVIDAIARLLADYRESRP